MIESIRRFFGSRYCLPTGSGTSGLFFALTAMNARGGTVLLPNHACENIVTAVLAAGARPLPVRVDARDYNLSPSGVAECVDDSTRAVVAVSSFGYPADIDGIRKAIGSNDIPIIDDACQAYGGEIDGVMAGNRGDVGIVSFGHAKPVDVKGGGLIITDSEELCAKVSELAAGASASPASTLKNTLMRALMLTGQFGIANHLAKTTSLLAYGMPPKCMAQLADKWPAFVDAIPHMRRNLQRVDEVIRNMETVIPFEYDWSLNWLPWRYSFKTASSSAREEIQRLLQEHGIRVSALYGPINNVESDDESGLQNVINLRYDMTVEETERLVGRLEEASDSLATSA